MDRGCSTIGILNPREVPCSPFPASGVWILDGERERDKERAEALGFGGQRQNRTRNRRLQNPRGCDSS